MQNKKELIQDLDFLSTLKSLAMAYEDISILKMQQTRNTIIHARRYVGKLKDILESIQRQGLLSKHVIISERKKNLATVVITANTKFHGDIIRRVFDKFSHGNQEEGDIFLIGSIGKELIADYDKSLKYTMFHVSDIDISMADLKPFIHGLLDYKKINVYYAIFKNLIQQDPIMTDIANTDLLSEEELALLQKDKNAPLFLFEPSVEEIQAFVNDNGVGLLLLQTIYETQLARFASRMKAMDALIQKIDEDSVILKLEEKKINRALEGSKQLQRLSGISLWQ